MSGRAIVLVGVSSVGKTSVSEELQLQLSDPFLHVGLDHFLAMFPQRWKGQAWGPGPGMWYDDTIDPDGAPRGRIRYGGGRPDAYRHAECCQRPPGLGK